MADSLKVFRVTNMAPIRSRGTFRSALVFADDPQDAFQRVMNFLNLTRKFHVADQSQFQVMECPIPDSLVFEVEVDGGIPQMRIDTAKLKKQ